MADDTNTQKIAQFNQRRAAGAQVAPLANNPTPVVTPSYRMSVNDIQLLQKMQDDPNSLTNEEKLRAQALATKDNLQKAEDDRKAREEQEREDAKARGDVKAVIQSEVSKGLRATSQRTSPAMNWFANRPTPGGIATLLVLIGIFLMAIVPVDNQGNTRLKLIWLTLTGKTHFEAFGGGAGGTFGPGSQNQPNTPITPNSANQQQSAPQTVIVPNTIDLFGGTTLL